MKKSQIESGGEAVDHALILLRQATDTSVSKMKSRLLALEIHLEGEAATKVVCFSWTALRKACLLSAGKQMYTCNQNLESVNHLFLHCPVATDMWSMFLSMLGIN